MEDITLLEKNAIKWAKEAGNILLHYFRHEELLDIQYKSSSSDLVTLADKEVEDFLIKCIEKEYPEHSVLGEENGERVRSSNYRWVIDPLDGTNNFSKGLPIFSISIGLEYNRETILGVVYVPYLSELYSAVKGQGAFLNGNLIKVSDTQLLERAVLTTEYPYDKHVNPDNNMANVQTLLPVTRVIRCFGSAAYDLCVVAAGFVDGYWEYSLHLWDISAGVLILQEAGGTVSYFKFEREISIIATNQRLHTELKNILR